jgi:O-antigen biosynthesis protein
MMDFRRDGVVGLEAARVPARCIDVELSEPLTDREYPDYRSVHALVRLHGTPVGALSAPLVDGRCEAATMRSAIIDELAPALVRVAVRHAIERPISAPPLDAERLVAAPPQPNDELPGVTVAVCTRDRPDQLRRCLDAIGRLRHPDVEVIVVDNSATEDATRCVVTAYADRIRQLRYEREPGLGLNRARNRAIMSATRDIIAFADDDVVVDPGWASAIARLFRASPEAQALTGLVVPFALETEAQLVFERYRGLGRGWERRWREDAGHGAHPIALRHGDTGELGTGANMAFRRSALATVGGFDPALDLGTVTNGGGDLDMFFRVIKAGGTLVYEPSAVARHEHRRELDALRQQLFNWGTAMRSYTERNRCLYEEEHAQFAALVRWLLGDWHLRRLVRSLFDRTIPTNLILAEMKGLLTGRSRYHQARVEADIVARRLGPSLPPARAANRSSRGGIRATHKIVDRVVDLAMPLAPLDDTRDAEMVRLHITVDGRPLATTLLAHHCRSVSVARLGDAIAQRASDAIAGLTGDVRYVVLERRELVARMLEALQPRVDGSRRRQQPRSDRARRNGSRRRR